MTTLAQPGDDDAQAEPGYAPGDEHRYPEHLGPIAGWDD
jgi:hypothetical protein